jgi:hypothetical protein
VLRNHLRNLSAMAAAMAVALVVAGGPSAALAANGDCGQPVSTGDTPTATDCLFILRAAVGTSTCDPVCICDLNASGNNPNATDALTCLNVSVGVEGLLNCDCGGTTTTTTTLQPGTTTTTSTTLEPGTTTTTSTTTTLGGGGGACPDTIELTLFAGTGPTCTNNGDCQVGTCDAGLSRCVTVTELDTGWTGISHDADVNDDQIIYATLDCGVGNTAPCGVCDVTGVTADNRTCRCANDNRAICDEPFVADADNCGGNVCNCYLGPPLPLSAGNTPACVVNRLSEDVTGTVDVDTGDAATLVKLRSVVYLGDTIITPCPYCEGDVTPGDGIRDGTCVVGEDAGAPCDVDAVNETFPAPGGDGHSLDCFPDVGKNVSGQGLIINLPQTTGSVSLDSNVNCRLFTIQYDCQCGVCGKACTTNADCSVTGGTCSTLDGACSVKSTDPCSGAGDCTGDWDGCVARGSGDPLPNQCAGGGGCTAGPDGDAVCDEGPSDLSCDAVVRANGEGFIKCQSNIDCDVGTIGIAAGNCTLTSDRECFLPTISAEGAPDPDTPVGAALFCIPPTGNAGINSVAGLPGPGRVVNQGRTRKFCGGADGTQYVTNSGCP